MADIHSAAEKNDVAFIQASDVVDALVYRSGGGSLGTPPTALHRDDVCGMLQEFHQKGGDINARNACATPQPDLPILALGRKCSEHCPRALPYFGRK